MGTRGPTRCLPRQWCCHPRPARLRARHHRYPTPDPTRCTHPPLPASGTCHVPSTHLVQWGCGCPPQPAAWGATASSRPPRHTTAAVDQQSRAIPPGKPRLPVSAHAGCCQLPTSHASTRTGAPTAGAVPAAPAFVRHSPPASKRPRAAQTPVRANQTPSAGAGQSRRPHLA